MWEYAMTIQPVSIPAEDVHKLLGAASGDALLLYLYIHSGNDFSDAADALRMNEGRLSCAAATLRQLGLWQTPAQVFIPGERPSYIEQDVLQSLQLDAGFRRLYGEVQRRLGRTLATEELKILLGFVRYLGMSADVIVLLVCYCNGYDGYLPHETTGINYQDLATGYLPEARAMIWNSALECVNHTQR
jgi:hypothetical protein